MFIGMEGLRDEKNSAGCSIFMRDGIRYDDWIPIVFTNTNNRIDGTNC